MKNMYSSPIGESGMSRRHHGSRTFAKAVQALAIRDVPTSFNKAPGKSKFADYLQLATTGTDLEIYLASIKCKAYPVPGYAA